MNEKYVVITTHGFNYCDTYSEALVLQSAYKAINIESVLVKPKFIYLGGEMS